MFAREKVDKVFIPVHVVRQSVVGRKEKVDGVDLRSLRQRRVHVRQRAVHVGVGRRLAVGPAKKY